MSRRRSGPHLRSLLYRTPGRAWLRQEFRPGPCRSRGRSSRATAAASGPKTRSTSGQAHRRALHRGTSAGAFPSMSEHSARVLPRVSIHATAVVLRDAASRLAARAKARCCCWAAAAGNPTSRCRLIAAGAACCGRPDCCSSSKTDALADARRHHPYTDEWKSAASESSASDSGRVAGHPAPSELDPEDGIARLPEPRSMPCRRCFKRTSKVPDAVCPSARSKPQPPPKSRPPPSRLRVAPLSQAPSAPSPPFL